MSSPTKRIVGHGLLSTSASQLAGGAAVDVHDTRIMAVLLDGSAHLKEQPEWYELDAVCDRMGLEPPETEPEWERFAARLRRRVDDAGLGRTYDLERRVLAPVAHMMARGVPVDRDLWQDMVVGRLLAAEDCAVVVKRELGALVWDESAVKRALWKKGMKVKSTGKKALVRYRDEPVVCAILDYNKHVTFLGDAALNVGTRIHAGRVHATLNPLGTATGRFTSMGPNLLGLEKGSPRRCVIAPEGRALVAVDYATADLRCLAAISQDAALIEAFQRGDDMHSLTASAVLKKPQASLTKEERNIGKATNFAVAFGAQPRGLAELAMTNYGVRISEDEARRFLEGFLQRFTGVAQWRDEVVRSCSPEARSPLGRLRSGMRRTPQRLNAPVQMATSDALKLAIAELSEPLAAMGADMLLPVHDELLVECPESEASQIARVVADGMVAAMEEVVGGAVPVEVEAFAGRSWGDLLAIQV